jgi:hypothetical protein
MINHALTLLVNREPQYFQDSGVYIDPGFRPRKTDHQLDRFRSTILSGYKTADIAINTALSAINLCLSPEYRSYTLAFDARYSMPARSFGTQYLDPIAVVQASLGCDNLFTAPGLEDLAVIWRSDSAVKDKAASALLGLIYNTHYFGD